MNSIQSELLARGVKGLLDSLTRRCMSLQQAQMLEERLQGGLRRLMHAHSSDFSSLQYIQGLNCLALLELQRAFSALASLYYTRAHRHNLRVKYLTDEHWRNQASADVRTRIWEEFWEFAMKGTDPEDHYADDPVDFLDEEDEEFDDGERGMTEEESGDDKLQVFLEWDHGCRGE